MHLWILQIKYQLLNSTNYVLIHDLNKIMYINYLNNNQHVHGHCMKQLAINGHLTSVIDCDKGDCVPCVEDGAIG